MEFLFPHNIIQILVNKSQFILFVKKYSFIIIVFLRISIVIKEQLHFFEKQI